MSRAPPEAYATGRLTERRLRPISPPPAAESPHEPNDPLLGNPERDEPV